MVKDDKYYKALNIEPTAGEDEIKKAYRKRAMQLHPDKNPSPEAAEQFKEISTAYEVLSDSEKRRIYDQFGEEGLNESGGGGGHSPFDIFESFFGGGGFGGRQGSKKGPRRGEDVVHYLAVTLEDLYKGKTTKLALNKHVVCTTCKGKGAKGDGPVKKCAGCHGSGVKMVVRQLGPGMLQQMQQVCPDCKGDGEIIAEKDKCTNCKGKKVIQEKKILEVHVEKGMLHQQKITFTGEADQAPDTEPGDIVIVLQQKEHPRFKRQNNYNLVMEASITLTQALCGAQLLVEHLDGRKLLVQTKPGEIIKPDDVKMVKDEGMPHYKRPIDKGVLFIKFNVKFPDSLSAQQVQELQKILPPPPPLSYKDEEVEHVSLDEYVPEERQANGRSRGGRSGEAYEDEEMEDDGGPRRQGVQCAQQ
mmetsp:Transcript_10396/g.16972  ORF Transcript_10396/g.16972 Transcript_10396/m.16972 type:complete len:416 (+) Transcript_10396:166-1413(+)|eukprot:CAMPEP_0184656470 /NCGR_PEP_ID=MMETSP0308-20130426/16527_1 /TAXON_ID=38269 /ORGANISM="Gloeochaete witrockiana, Strain SAG 46.84" /LENGTH=415 /DNA_ID=CAMNT_0027093617 /DNA_START=148 /DNA_END=1398 /DNA_ORIENTATION=+